MNRNPCEVSHHGIFDAPISGVGEPLLLTRAPSGVQLSRPPYANASEGLVVISPGRAQHELGDPAEYYVRDERGRVTSVIQTGTGNHFIESNTIRGLVSGNELFRVRSLKIFANSSQKKARLTHTGRRLPWDLIFLESIGTNGKSTRYAYAGVITHHPNSPTPKFPRDNHLREIHVLVERDGMLCDLGPLMPRPLDKERIWIGHCYGPKFVREDDGKLYIVYEKVVEQTTRTGRQLPRRTDLFRREMISACEASETEELVLSAAAPLDAKPYTSVRRDDGAQLIEGLAVSAKTKVTAASGDSRHLRIASWSAGDYRKIYGAFIGEWTNGHIKPLFNSKGDDFANVLLPIASKYRLRGAGRLSFVTAPDTTLMRNTDESLIVRFQAYLPGEKRRRIFFARAYLSLDQQNQLKVEIVDRINDPYDHLAACLTNDNKSHQITSIF